MLMPLSEPTVNPDLPSDEQQIARKVEALKNRLRGQGRRRGRGGRTETTGNGRDSVPNSE